MQGLATASTFPGIMDEVQTLSTCCLGRWRHLPGSAFKISDLRLTEYGVCLLGIWGGGGDYNHMDSMYDGNSTIQGGVLGGVSTCSVESLQSESKYIRKCNEFVSQIWTECLLLAKSVIIVSLIGNKVNISVNVMIIYLTDMSWEFATCPKAFMNCCRKIRSHSATCMTR